MPYRIGLMAIYLAKQNEDNPKSNITHPRQVKTNGRPNLSHAPVPRAPSCLHLPNGCANRRFSAGIGRLAYV